MKKTETFAYITGIIFYTFALIFGIGLFFFNVIPKPEKTQETIKFKEVDQAALEVVDGLEELHLAVQMDLKSLEEKYDG